MNGPMAAAEDLLSIKIDVKNTTHCYSFIMRVVLAVFPHSVQPKNQHHLYSRASYHDSFFLWGDGRRRAWMLYWQGGFRAQHEWQSCPIRLDSCWLQLGDVFPRVCHLWVLTHGCVFACQAADLPAQDVGFFFLSSTYFYVFQQVVFCTCECSFAIFECILYAVSVCVCVQFAWCAVTSSSTAVKVLCSWPPSALPDDFQKLPLFTQLQWHVCPLSSKPGRHSSSAGLIVSLSHVSLEKQANIWSEISFNPPPKAMLNNPVSSKLVCESFLNWLWA